MTASSGCWDGEEFDIYPPPSYNSRSTAVSKRRHKVNHHKGAPIPWTPPSSPVRKQSLSAWRPKTATCTNSWQDFGPHDKQIKHKTSTYLEVHTFPDDSKSGKATEYFVGAEVTGLEEVAEGLVVKHLPAGTYAVFTHRLAEGGYTGCNQRMENWLKTGPYRLSPTFRFRYSMPGLKVTTPRSRLSIFFCRLRKSNRPEGCFATVNPVVQQRPWTQLSIAIDCSRNSRWQTAVLSVSRSNFRHGCRS